jgi:uncharacterized protein YgiB involved in biofilm formation
MGFVSEMAEMYVDAHKALFTGIRDRDGLDFMLGAVTWATSALVGGLMYLGANALYASHKDEMEMNRLSEAPTVVFRDIAHCQAQGNEPTFCVDAFRAAKAKHDRQGNRYSTMLACEQNHSAENCTAQPYRSTTYILVGKVLVPQHRSGIHYVPSFGGVQALKGDPNVATPLYKTADAAKVLRPDLRSVVMQP